MTSFPVIDRYEVRRGLGRGAMGSVYLAYDAKIGREVAVKVLDKEYALNAKHRERFDREARAIAALRHPNIVELYDYGGSTDEHIFLVMEFIEGPNVGSFCRDAGPFPETILTALGMELSAALGHAHDAGIIHRDLKPENVFLDKGRLVLADFGIVKAIAENNPLGAAAAAPRTDVIGTPGFMAPEQLEQLPLDERTDVFAFGALLYYLASQHLPYKADSPYGLLQVFRETRPTPLRDQRPEISEDLSALVQQCLEVDPALRPANAKEIHGRLLAVLRSLGARDPRELLAEFEADPQRFAQRDQQRVVEHLLGRLKIAVRDADGIRADEIRRQLGVLAPDSDEAMTITGVPGLLKRTHIPPDPEIIIARAGRRWGYLAVGLTLGAASAGVWYLTQPTASTTNQAVRETKLVSATMVRVRASERTHVFIDGRALGTTPNLPPTPVTSGLVSLEFLHDRRGSLRHETELVADEAVIFIVDWHKRTVRKRPFETSTP